MRPAGPSSAAAAAVHQPRRLPPGSSCVRFTASPRLTVAAAARQQRGATAAPATTAAAPLPSPLGPAAFQLQAAGEVDRLLYPRSPLGELEHRAEAVVHTAQRLEYRLQRRAAALPAAVRRLVAGGLAGACAKTATAPLSTVQMAQMTSAGVNAVQAVATIWQRAGVRGFFRGNTVDVLRTVPSRSIELSCYDALKRTFRRWNRKHSGDLHIPDQAVATLAGGLAGVIASVSVHPLELARTRQALGATHGSALAALGDIVRAGGPRALFKGLDASLVGVVPYAAIRLGAYDGLRHLWRRSTGRKDVDARAALLFGALAGVVSAAAAFPLEVIRRRMMAGAAHPHFVAAAAAIVREEGAAALVNGLPLSLVKIAPQTAVTFAVYEEAKRFLEV